MERADQLNVFITRCNLDNLAKHRLVRCKIAPRLGVTMLR